MKYSTYILVACLLAGLLIAFIYRGFVSATGLSTRIEHIFKRMCPGQYWNYVDKHARFIFGSVGVTSKKVTKTIDVIVFQVTSFIVGLGFCTYFLFISDSAFFIAMLFTICLCSLPTVRMYIGAKKKESLCERELPFFIELVVLLMESGLDFDSAVKRIIETRQGYLVSLFRHAKSMINSGMKREEAYLKIVAVNSASLAVMIKTVLAAEAQGRPVDQILRAVADTARTKQISRIEARANRLPVTMLFPIFIFIIPPVLLLYVLPAIVNLRYL